MHNNKIITGTKLHFYFNFIYTSMYEKDVFVCFLTTSVPAFGVTVFLLHAISHLFIVSINVLLLGNIR